MNNARLTIFCGFPGSGKSYSFQHGDNPPNSVVLCPDDFRFAATGKWFHAPVEEFIWGTVKLTARTLLSQGYHVIIDATNLTVGSRAQWIHIANDVGCPIDCVWINTSIEDCWARNSERIDDRRVPDTVMNRMLDSFVEPSIDEGFDRIIARPDFRWYDMQSAT